MKPDTTLQYHGSHVVAGHEYEDGACKVCGLTSSDSSEFDFIRSWYRLIGQEPVTAADLAQRINEGTLPNKVSRKTPVDVGETQRFVRKLVRGMVVVGDDIVDVVYPKFGTYRTAKRSEASPACE